MRVPTFVATTIAITTCLVPFASPQRAKDQTMSIVSGFQNPPESARPRAYWWWLNGNTDKETITSDLEAMARQGYGGATLMDANGSETLKNRPVAAGPTYGSPAWTELFLHSLKEAKRLKLEISLSIQSGWNLGGPSVKPEQAIKLLTWSRQVVQGVAGAQLPLQLGAPPQKNGFYRDIAVLAYPLHHGAALAGAKGSDRKAIRDLKPKAVFIEPGFSNPDTKFLLGDYPSSPHEDDYSLDEVRDISDRMSASGTLNWVPPTGEWEILRIGYTCSGVKVSTSSGAWQGLVLDYMDHEAFEDYWGKNIEPMLKLAAPYTGSSLRNVYTDSWEVGGINWTGRFRTEFKQRRGYDLLPYLPIITGRILQDRDTSDRFLNDFRRTIGDLILTEHYQTFKRLAAVHGLGLHAESGGPHAAPLDALKVLGVDTFPQTEYWAPSKFHRITDVDRFFVKEASSAGHIYGKTLIAAEGMTSAGPQWEESVGRDLKPAIDQAFCEGFNLLFWHTWTSSPKASGLPGQEYFAGTHLNPKTTWFQDSKAFISYIQRTQFMMQQGVPVSDVLYYYGDQVPNYVQIKGADPAGVMPGFDYDVLNEEILTTGLHVRGGKILLANGTSYEELVLPPIPTASYDSLLAIQKLLNAGAVIVGKKPEHLTGLPSASSSEQRFEDLASKIWDQCDGVQIQSISVGAGTLVCGKTALATLANHHVVKDFSTADDANSSSFDYVHRKMGDTDIYFVRNTTSNAVHAGLNFRITGRQPELWSSETGEVQPQYLYTETGDGRTALPISLAPYGSTLVVFRNHTGHHFTQASIDGVQFFPSHVSSSPEVSIHEKAGRTSFLGSIAGTYRFVDDRKHETQAIAVATQETAVDAPWHIAFTPGRGAPATADWSSLMSWTDDNDPGIRFFSGTGDYTTSFLVPSTSHKASTQLFLDLGDVRETAHVFLNGHDLGILWHSPYRVEVTAVIQEGKNELRVLVTNLWPNRLIGDQSLPMEQRTTHTNITKFDQTSPLIVSGLIGPVRVIRSDEMVLSTH